MTSCDGHVMIMWCQAHEEELQKLKQQKKDYDQQMDEIRILQDEKKVSVPWLIPRLLQICDIFDTCDSLFDTCDSHMWFTILTHVMLLHNAGIRDENGGAGDSSGPAAQGRHSRGETGRTANGNLETLTCDHILIVIICSYCVAIYGEGEGTRRCTINKAFWGTYHYNLHTKLILVTFLLTLCAYT